MNVVVTESLDCTMLMLASVLKIYRTPRCLLEIDNRWRLEEVSALPLILIKQL